MKYNEYGDYNAVRTAMIKDAHKIRIANKIVKVSGERRTLPLKERELDMVYYPALDGNEFPISEKRPLIVGLHGGGFIFGGAALDDAMWVAVSKALCVNIASIDYRLCPDYKWDDSITDCLDSTLYLIDHAEEFGFDSNHISLMGQSAGASIATTSSLAINLVKNNISLDEKFDASLLNNKKIGSINYDNVILVYPMLDQITAPDDKGPGSYSGIICYVSNDLHCNDENIYSPLVSPIVATEEMLKCHPATIIVYSENDNLRHEAEKYGKMLKDVGVSAKNYLAEGMPHEFFECGFKAPSKFELQFLGENGSELAKNGKLKEGAIKALSFIKDNFNY
ncbi:MAG: alpha/beta hydrolase [Lachnospiraceae bacterium]|nr:alpha/beta hydrolase [Lachnospiraceae bacterium]